MSEKEKELTSFSLPSILVLNKVDLVTNKVKLRTLQNELEDLGSFEKIFHTSVTTGFGIDALKEYLL
jgi:GTP-binding protein Era